MLSMDPKRSSDKNESVCGVGSNGSQVGVLFLVSLSFNFIN